MRLKGEPDGRAAEPCHAQSPQFSPKFLPLTGHAINLIASSCCATLPTHKWVCSAMHAVFVCTCMVIHGERRGRALSLHHMVKVGI